MTKTVYRLTIEDVQIVAQEELGRELTTSEVKQIVELIADRISWYDAIADSIAEKKFKAVEEFE